MTVKELKEIVNKIPEVHDNDILINDCECTPGYWLNNVNRLKFEHMDWGQLTVIYIR